MFEDFLKDIGLSEKEALVYLALLEVDADTINDLAKKTGINRTTVYPVLESLSKKGLVSEVQSGKKTAYLAEPPERLETYVERQKVLLEEKSARLKDVVPQLKSIQRDTGERPIVKYFEGRDGVISAYKNFYQNYDATRGVEKYGHFVTNYDLVNEIFNENERDQLVDKRVARQVRPITIYNNKNGDYNFRTKGYKRKRLDGKKYPINCDVSIIGDQTIITTLDENVSSVLIKSKDIANTLSSIIEAAHDS